MNHLRKRRWHYQTFLVFWYILVLLFIIHFNACFYCFITEELNKAFPEYENTTWIYKLEEHFEQRNKRLQARDIYMHCVLEMMMKINGNGQMGILSPSSLVSYLIQFYYLLVGYIIQIIIFRSFYRWFSLYYENSIDFEKDKQLTEAFLNTKWIPNQLRKDILTQQKEKHHATFAKFKYLNDSLTAETSPHATLNEFSNIQVFREIPRKVFYEFIKFMHPQVYLPNQVLYTIGEIADRFYGITHGSIAIYIENNIEIMHLRDNEFFGYGITDTPPKRISTAIAIESTEVWYITREDFLYVMSCSPELYEWLELYKTINRKWWASKVAERLKEIKETKDNQEQGTSKNSN